MLRVASLEAAASFGAAGAGERDSEESPGADGEELPVADPWVDPTQPHASTLDAARQLRMALLDCPDLPALLNAVGALSDDKCAVIVLELALDACWTRTLGGGAGATRQRSNERSAITFRR